MLEAVGTGSLESRGSSNGSLIFSQAPEVIVFHLVFPLTVLTSELHWASLSFTELHWASLVTSHFNSCTVWICTAEAALTLLQFVGAGHVGTSFCERARGADWIHPCWHWFAGWGVPQSCPPHVLLSHSADSTTYVAPADCRPTITARSQTWKIPAIPVESVRLLTCVTWNMKRCTSRSMNRYEKHELLKVTYQSSLSYFYQILLILSDLIWASDIHWSCQALCPAERADLATWGKIESANHHFRYSWAVLGICCNWMYLNMLQLEYVGICCNWNMLEYVAIGLQATRQSSSDLISPMDFLGGCFIFRKDLRS